MSRRKVATTVYITKDQDQALKVLAERTDKAVAYYIREGIDLILSKYKSDLPQQFSLLDETTRD